MGTEENTLSEEQRLKGVMAPYRDKASTHKDQCPETVKAYQFPHGIEENHLGVFLDQIVLHPMMKGSSSSTMTGTLFLRSSPLPPTVRGVAGQG